MDRPHGENCPEVLEPLGSLPLMTNKLTITVATSSGDKPSSGRRHDSYMLRLRTAFMAWGHKCFCSFLLFSKNAVHKFRIMLI